MALHYDLAAFKILLSVPIIMGTFFSLFFKDKSSFIKEDISFSSVVFSAFKSFFDAIFSCKFTSLYSFINQYTALATAQGRFGGGGGGHGKDDWVMLNLSHQRYESMIQKNYNSKLHFITP